MDKIRKALPYIIIISLIISNVYLFQKVYYLKIKADENYDEIRIISSKVKELKKQISIFESMEVEIGELNTQSLMIPLHIQITPKTPSNVITADLVLKDKNLPMTQKGNSFELNTQISVFERFQQDEMKIIITEGEKKLTENLDNHYIYDMRHMFLLGINGEFVGQRSHSLGKYSINGESTIRIDNINDNYATHIQYMIELNGHILDEKSFAQPKVNRAKKINIRESYNFNPEDNFIDYFLVTDKYGIVYKYVISSLGIDKNGGAYIPALELNGLTEIYNKEGKLIWEGGI